MRQLFGQDQKRLEDGTYKNWENVTPKNRDGVLATILFCDAIMRALHIDSKEAYKHEKKAIELARKVMVNPNMKSKYKMAERLFIIQPLMRSESLDDINLALELVTAEIETAKARDLSWSGVAKNAANRNMAKENQKVRKKFIQMLEQGERFRDMVE